MLALKAVIAAWASWADQRLIRVFEKEALKPVGSLQPFGSIHALASLFGYRSGCPQNTHQAQTTALSGGRSAGSWQWYGALRDHVAGEGRLPIHESVAMQLNFNRVAA